MHVTLIYKWNWDHKWFLQVKSQYKNNTIFFFNVKINQEQNTPIKFYAYNARLLSVND
jgi:hypothetical protein